MQTENTKDNKMQSSKEQEPGNISELKIPEEHNLPNIPVDYYSIKDLTTYLSSSSFMPFTPLINPISNIISTYASILPRSFFVVKCSENYSDDDTLGTQLILAMEFPYKFCIVVEADNKTMDDFINEKLIIVKTNNYKFPEVRKLLQSKVYTSHPMVDFVGRQIMKFLYSDRVTAMELWEKLLSNLKDFIKDIEFYPLKC